MMFIKIQIVVALFLVIASTAKAAVSVDDFYLDDFTSFSGPTLGNINAQSVDDHGVQSDANPISFDNEFSSGYIFDKKSMFIVGPDVRFYYKPSNLSQKKIVNNDWGLKAMDKKTIDHDGLRVATSLEILVPTSDYSRGRNMDWGLKSVPYFWYQFHDSKYKVGAWTEFKVYSGVTSGQKAKLYFEPYVSYDVTERFSWQLGYEVEYDNFVGLSGFRTVERDIQPGFSYNLTHSIFISPYLQIFPFDTVSWKTTAFNLYLGFRIL